MKRKRPIGITVMGVFFFAWSMCAAASAQEKPGTTGSVSFGFASARNSIVLDQGRDNVFGIIQLDHKGVVLDPRFISYEITPRYSKGIEDFYTGQKSGSGVGFSSQFFPKSPWPFWFSYSRFRNLAPGGSEFPQDSASNSSDLSFGGVYAVEGRPTISVTYDRFNGSTDLENATLPISVTDGNRFSLSGDYRLKDWRLNARISTNSDAYRLPREINAGLLDSDSSGRNLDFSIQRDLGPNATFRVSGFRNRSERISDIVDSSFDAQQIRSYFKYFNKKLQYSFQYDKTQLSNRQELKFSLADPDESRVASGSRSGQSLRSSVVYDIKPYLDISGDLRYASEEQFEGQAYSGGDSSFYGSPGIRFHTSSPSWGMNARYKLQFAPDSLGHSASAGVRVGNPSLIQTEGNVYWARTRIEQGLLFGDREQVVGGALDFSKRALGFLFLEVRGEYQTRVVSTQNQDTDDILRGFRIRIQLPRIQLSYSRRIMSIDNWLYSWVNPLEAQLLSVAGTASMVAGQPDESLQFAATDSPLKAHGQYAQYLPSLPAADPASSRDKVISITGTAPELASQFSNSGRSNTTLAVSFALTHNMRLYGSWEEGSRKESLKIAGLSNSYSLGQKRLTFEWRIRQTSVEASYHLSQYGVASEGFRKGVIVKVTRYFNLF